MKMTVIQFFREYYADPNFFIGKKLVFVSNLEPRVIRGLESQGMVVAVDGFENQPIFLVPENDVPNGSKAR
jgi:methionyl-tRNA synthetase